MVIRSEGVFDFLELHHEVVDLRRGIDLTEFAAHQQLALALVAHRSSVNFVQMSLTKWEVGEVGRGRRSERGKSKCQ